ncbi:hypothetical protein ON010_g238 [Phytophthora cinnamomi]|nr:hypothetical protein ON010_g238 [Phytophthora cinnamomi]
MYSIQANFFDSVCSSAPYAVYATQDGTCEEETCYEAGSSDGVNESSTIQCSTDYLQAIRDAFAGSEYSIQEIFSDNTCSTFEFAFGFLVTNSCTGGALTYDYYFTSNITDTGRASVQFFHNEVGSSSAADSACMYGSVEADAAKDQLEHHTCLAIDSEFALYDLYGPEIAYKCLPHVMGFLAEANMTASMDHPHIVKLIGVSWDSLSDLCVVLELMDGGDLRAMLNTYEMSNHPVGFDRKKATIALQICHALTYLHSLMPPVIHRDLKSRNILLNRAMDAKLTDFGISRERLDQTMTAGVGTSLWMAPEVMLGERYDVKADMFSFGIVLSELDNHALPYTQARQRTQDNDGHPMPDASLLQKITTGSVRIAFSGSSPSSVVELGLACVSIEPDNRPTAAEALYRLQVVLSQACQKLPPGWQDTMDANGYRRAGVLDVAIDAAKQN